jgi:hypothetical protein
LGAPFLDTGISHREGRWCQSNPQVLCHGSEYSRDQTSTASVESFQI